MQSSIHIIQLHAFPPHSFAQSQLLSHISHLVLSVDYSPIDAKALENKKAEFLKQNNEIYNAKSARMP